jgi:hypothetical protein
VQAKKQMPDNLEAVMLTAAATCSGFAKQAMAAVTLMGPEMALAALTV